MLFDHIALATARLADAPAVLAGQLGGAPAYGGDSGAYRFWQWRFAGGGRLEVLEPRGDNGFLHRFLAERGPGIHHVTFKVESLAEACGRAQARGFRIVGRDESDPQWKEAFLHPREALGIVVQLAEAAGSGEPPLRSGAPPGPLAPPPPVTILGLRMRARSAERARVLWEEILLGAAAPAAGGEVVYRWPGSPMRIVVEMDPAGAEGPVAIEYASDRAVSLPPGRHPVLGAVFARQKGRECGARA